VRLSLTRKNTRNAIEKDSAPPSPLLDMAAQFFLVVARSFHG